MACPGRRTNRCSRRPPQSWFVVILSLTARTPLLSWVVRYHVVGEVSEVVQVSVRKDILNLITETEP